GEPGPAADESLRAPATLMQQGGALQGRLPGSDHGNFPACEDGQVAVLRAMRDQAVRRQARRPSRGRELVGDVGEAVQPAGHYHDVGLELLAVAQRQAKTAARPLKPAYPQVFDIGNELLLKPPAVICEQLDGHYLITG